MDNKQTVMGKRIKSLRKESRLTQEQLAEFLNIDQSMVTKLENGTRSLTITLLDKICSLFGCTEEFLLGESNEYIPLNFAFRSNGIAIGNENRTKVEFAGIESAERVGRR